MGTVEHDARRAVAARPVRFDGRSAAAARYLEASIYLGMRGPRLPALVPPADQVAAAARPAPDAAPVETPAQAAPAVPVTGSETDRDADQVVAATLDDRQPEVAKTGNASSRWWAGGFRWRRRSGSSS